MKHFHQWVMSEICLGWEQMQLAALGLLHFLTLIVNNLAYVHLSVMLILTANHAPASGGSCIGTISFFRSDPSCLRNKNAKHTLLSGQETNMAENIIFTQRVATYGSGIKIQK